MVVLTIVSRVVLELFQPQRVPGRLRLQLVRSREAEQEAVEAEEEKEEEKEEEEEEEQRGGGTTEAEAAPEQPRSSLPRQSWKMWPYIWVSFCRAGKMAV